MAVAECWLFGWRCQCSFDCWKSVCVYSLVNHLRYRHLSILCHCSTRRSSTAVNPRQRMPSYEKLLTCSFTKIACACMPSSCAELRWSLTTCCPRSQPSLPWPPPGPKNPRQGQDHLNQQSNSDARFACLAWHALPWVSIVSLGSRALQRTWSLVSIIAFFTVEWQGALKRRLS